MQLTDGWVDEAEEDNCAHCADVVGEVGKPLVQYLVQAVAHAAQLGRKPVEHQENRHLLTLLFCLPAYIRDQDTCSLSGKFIRLPYSPKFSMAIWTRPPKLIPGSPREF